MSTEILEGYVVDIACLRKFPRDQVAERARRHSRRCGMMGHCVESGFGLVEVDGPERVMLLDAKATPQVLEALRAADKEEGVRLRVERQPDEDGHMETNRVELVG